MSQTTTFDPAAAVARELKHLGIAPEWLVRGFELVQEGRQNGRLVGMLSIFLHYEVGTALRNAVRVHAAEANAPVPDDQTLDDRMIEWVRSVVKRGLL